MNRSPLTPTFQPAEFLRTDFQGFFLHGLESLEGLSALFAEIFVRWHMVKAQHIAEATASIKQQNRFLGPSNRE